MNVPSSVRYRFGEFELDLDLYAVRRAGRAVRVIPKVFDMLHLLVAQHGRVLTKQELLATLWADRQVGEGTIPWTINQARRALGQRRGDKRPIETVYGRGYRFVGQVEVLRLAAQRPPAPPSASSAN